MDREKRGGAKSYRNRECLRREEREVKTKTDRREEEPEPAWFLKATGSYGIIKDKIIGIICLI